MQIPQKLDVHGLSVRGDGHERNHDHFAIATLSKSLKLHQSNLTIDDESRVHGHNQGHLFLVADGVSGGPAPARASGTAVDSVVQYFLNEMPWYHLADGTPADVTLALEDALKNAQDELLRSVPCEDPGPGTTMTLAFVFWPHLYVAHVGDSRCYLGRGGELSQLTTDHTLAEVCRDLGGSDTPRSRHVLWNAVGGGEQRLQPEIRHVLLEPGDELVLVTDGVTKEQSASDLRALLERVASAEEACGRLVNGSGRDDRTAIVVRFLPLEPVGATRAERDPLPSPLTAVRGAPHQVPRSEPCETTRRARRLPPPEPVLPVLTAARY
jgi:protein phosphatase